MTDEERRKSYERYKQWQYNKNRYQHENIAYVVLFAICFFAFLKYGVVVLIVGVFVIIYRLFIKKNINSQDKKSERVTEEDNEEKTQVYIIDRKNNMKSTEKGYINKNNQRNNGKTDQQGTGNLQWFYDMECLNCGHRYYANGHDIWLRKCPNCQGGKP